MTSPSVPTGPPLTLKKRSAEVVPRQLASRSIAHASEPSEPSTCTRHESTGCPLQIGIISSMPTYTYTHTQEHAYLQDVSLRGTFSFHVCWKLPQPQFGQSDRAVRQHSPRRCCSRLPLPCLCNALRPQVFTLTTLLDTYLWRCSVACVLHLHACIIASTVMPCQ